MDERSGDGRAGDADCGATGTGYARDTAALIQECWPCLRIMEWTHRE